MKWFKGGINEAVATSKSRKAIFVVFVEGKDAASVQLAQAIDTAEVSARLEDEAFVAIRLESGSESYNFFAQIYHLVPVPSIFFIQNGIPVEIVAGSVTVADLISKIDGLLVKAGKTSKASSQNLIAAEQKATVSSATSSASDDNTPDTGASNTDAEFSTTPDKVVITKPPAEETTSGDSKETKSNDLAHESAKEDDPPTIQSKQEVEETKEHVEESKEQEESKQQVEESKPKEESKQQVEESKPTEESPTRELTVDEKLERAKQLIEQQRKQRIEEEQKKQRERELERRKLGRDVQKLKQKQQDLEVKLAHEEKMREKAADAAAREKIRKQIEQDRLERKEKQLALQQELQQKQQNAEQPKQPTPMRSDATVTRIQFRLPSGNPHMGQFDPNSTLGALRNYVIENIELPFRQFSMSISFPRRDLTTDDDDKTLLELELVPTAVILILPLKNSATTTTITSSRDVGLLSGFMSALFARIIGVYNYIVSYFSSGAPKHPQRQQNDAAEVRETSSNADGAVPVNPQNVTNLGLLRRYLGSQGGTKIRAEGNIHRLHSGGDDNDENNTWNGNSTQQM